MAAKSGQLPPDALERIRRVLGGRGQAVPFAYVVARTSEDQAVVVAGTDLPAVRKQDTWWETTGWPVSAHDALIGAKAAGLVSASKPFELSFQQRKIVLNPAGILRTGSSEDSRIFIGLDEFQTWTGVPASTAEVAVSGPAAQINAVMHDIETAVPDAEVRPVRQLVDRRRDFAVMKALGASNLTIHGFFAAEAAALGAGGGVIGFVGGTGIAAWISHSNFDTALSPRLLVFPPVLLGSIAIALLAAAVPMSLLGRIEPANILRGE